MSRRKAEMILELVDRATRPARRFIALQGRIGKAVERANQTAARAARGAQRAASRTERTLATLARTGRKAFRTVADSARRAGRAITTLHQETLHLGRFGMERIGQGWNRARGGLLTGAAAVTVAYGSAAAAASGLVGTASEFERFQTILTTTEGSAAAAKEAMGWVQTFAVKTPYELDQVTSAFVSLRAYGLDPTDGLLRTLGDTSAAMGKPLGQAVEAIADAVTGENERLKEFGIKASKTGNRITYEYTNAANETVRTAVEAGNRMAIQQTLMGIMNEKYAGSMERLSRTWDGMVANVFDLWTKFQMMIMDSGLFDWMKGKLGEVLETLDRMEADGTLQAWATEIGETIRTALINMWTFGKGVWEVLQQVGGYLSTAAEYVGGWKNLSMILAGIVFAPTLIGTAAGLVQIASGLAALSGALMVNPIVLAIALIAGGVYLIYRNWDAIGPYFRRLWDGVKATVRAVWAWLKTAFGWTPLGMIINNWGMMSDALAGPVAAGKAAIDVVWEALKAVLDWTPLGRVISNWDGVSAALSDPIETGKAVIDTVWNGIKALFSWTPIDPITENWTGIGKALSAPIDAGIALATAAWDRVKSIFSGDWLPEIDTSTLSTAMNTINGIVQGGWDVLSGIFDTIVSGATKLGEAVGTTIEAAMRGAEAALSAISGSKGVDRIFDQLGGLAERGFGADFVQGQALTEALSAGEIGLETYRKTLEAVSREGGAFAQTAREMIDAARQLDDFRMPEPPAPQLPPTRDVDTVMARLAEIETVSSRVPGIVETAMTSIQSILNTENFADRGAALMQSLADGMRSRLAEVTAAAAAITRAIRNGLPNAVPMTVGVQGGTSVQARAGGGAFGPGWLLTGEHGPELEYRTRGGFIAHNRALQTMLAMSRRVARTAANANRSPGWLQSAAMDIASGGGADGGAAIGARYLDARPSGQGAGNGPISVTMTFNGPVDRQVLPDIQAMKDDLLERLQELLEDTGRAARRREHA